MFTLIGEILLCPSQRLQRFVACTLDQEHGTDLKNLIGMRIPKERLADYFWIGLGSWLFCPPDSLPLSCKVQPTAPYEQV